MNYSSYSNKALKDIARLRRRISQSKLPGKISDHNLIIATWNIQKFGQIYPKWSENPNSPKRNKRGLAIIAEIIRRFDVVALQEVMRDYSGLRMLLEDFLGANWGLILSDVTAGDPGNSERLAFLYDKRRVEPSGLAGEIVLPAKEDGNPVTQFARTPYIVGFKAGNTSFALLTTHILYGESEEDRIPELQAMADFVANEIRDRAISANQDESNLIVLGDFNISTRGENPLFQAFRSTGLIVPPQLTNVKTTVGKTAKHYDQIAWFMDKLDLTYNNAANAIDFTGAVYRELRSNQLPSRVSDHFPLWVEFIIDRSQEEIGQELGLDAMGMDALSADMD
ncbi:MAG: endonuclease/exonuclease/phosphatase family protein [Anaerolineae bacterium]|nr:endonuclease/exonuclease/phosphatase family protein [Anaerolineae bacterium]